MSRLLALSLAVLLAACSASSNSGKKASSADSEFKESSTENTESTSSESEDSPKETPEEGPSCLDAKGDAQECTTDSDCCKGFYCGIDPAGSTRIKVCLYGG